VRRANLSTYHDACWCDCLSGCISIDCACLGRTGRCPQLAELFPSLRRLPAASGTRVDGSRRSGRSRNFSPTTIANGNHQGLDHELIDGEPAKGRVGRVRRQQRLVGCSTTTPEQRERFDVRFAVAIEHYGMDVKATAGWGIRQGAPTTSTISWAHGLRPRLQLDRCANPRRPRLSSSRPRCRRRSRPVFSRPAAAVLSGLCVARGSGGRRSVPDGSHARVAV
jgi:hypothetical protein